MTDSSGAVVWSADYLPFGQADVTIGTVENNLRFAGQYYDSETGLHYNYYRYSDPSLGRYLRADPIGIKGGINLYAYTANRPIISVDPSGLIPPGWWEENGPEPTGPYTDPNPCDKYKKLFNTKCCRSGSNDSDPYPEKAHSVCNRFMKMYNYRSNSTVRCVAKCLTQAEEFIQSKYSSCSQRNSARLSAHVGCYASCGFIPYKGQPEGGADVGVNMLVPDFLRNPLSIWDSCVK